ncbi:MAG: hypothetical protein AAFY91_03545 [Bacteroidota bacterium]
MRDRLVKGGTLLLFSALVISFVLYSAGCFYGSAIDESATAGSNANPDSTGGRQLMPSSKVLILDDNLRPNPTGDQSTTDSFTRPDMIYSSKSGIIFKPEDMVIDTARSKAAADSLRRLDSLNRSSSDN